MPERPTIAAHCFSLVVVRLGRRFLVVKERKHGGGFYLPAGRVEPGESFADAALRETREEAGLDVVLEGVLRVEHTPMADRFRVRVFFVARPKDDAPPKSVADEHSEEARWVTVEELQALPLRGPEVREWFEHVERGGQVFPLSVLVPEGAPLLK